MDGDGEADLVGPGGRPLVAGRQVEREEVRPAGARPAPGQDVFREAVFGGQRVLALVSTLSAAGDAYGRLHLLKSLAPIERSERIDALPLLRRGGRLRPAEVCAKGSSPNFSE